MRKAINDQIYNVPLRGGTGLEPRFITEPYKGIPLTEDVKARIAAYRALPSYVPAQENVR